MNPSGYNSEGVDHYDDNNDEENHDDYLNDEENHGDNMEGVDHYSINDNNDDEQLGDYSEGDDVVSEEGERTNSGWEAAAGFNKWYNVYPFSFIEKTNLEVGNKIIMPESALRELMDEGVGFPMLFKIENQSKEKISHCGVLEFTGEEGAVFMPEWMMKNMALEDGDMIHLKNVDLDKATFVKLQPHSVDFLDIRIPKYVLENAFCSGYACLTVGDTIVIKHQGKTLYVDIVEAMPSNAVCVIETDVEVDFARPLDYKEPPKPVPKPLPKPEKDVKEPLGFVPFSGRGSRLNDSNNTTKEDLAAAVISNTSTKVSSETSNTGQSVKPFTGKKYSLKD
uniref:Uncharacterized protein n=2 Tax=Chenopodium quinoa TaxID=63459 RepID=A0A803LM26_CHEQI